MVSNTAAAAALTTNTTSSSFDVSSSSVVVAATSSSSSASSFSSSHGPQSQSQPRSQQHANEPVTFSTTRYPKDEVIRSSSSASSSSASSSSSPTNTNRRKSSAATRAKITRSIGDAAAGAAAGMLAKTAVAPIERVKLLMQLQQSLGRQQNQQKHIIRDEKSINNKGTSTSNMRISGSSAWNVARTVYREEGILAFWRGNTPNVIRQGGATALNFMLMDWYKAATQPIFNATLALPSNRPHAERKKRRKIVSSFLSGGLAGGTTTTVLYPIEFLRTRLALDIGTGNGSAGSKKECSRMYPRGMRDVFCSIWKTDGIKGMYQGYGIALSGVVLYRALHLGGYDACKTELLHRRQKAMNAGAGAGAGAQQTNVDTNGNASMTMIERFAVAQTVSVVAGTLCYPIDSVRRRLMMQAGHPVDMRKYSNSIHAFRLIFAEEGLRGFYLGIGPNLIRSFGGALLLVSYDVFKGMVM